MTRSLIKTRYVETGQDGIIHHSSFVIYLEEARVDFFQSMGVCINALEAEGVFCPVVHLSLDYLKTVKFSDVLIVKTSLKSFEAVKFYLDYQIFREQEAVCRAYSKHCFLNKAFKPIPIPKLIRAQFALLKENEE
ncbi:MAG: acyl-CoA thioesterase [Rhabdochlamydiaceae bacterium]